MNKEYQSREDIDKLDTVVKRLRESHPEFLKEQWADGYISAEELYEKLMTIRRFIDRTIEHALSWEEEYGGDEE